MGLTGTDAKGHPKSPNIKALLEGEKTWTIYHSEPHAKRASHHFKRGAARKQREGRWRGDRGMQWGAKQGRSEWGRHENNAKMVEECSEWYGEEGRGRPYFVTHCEQVLWSWASHDVLQTPALHLLKVWPTLALQRPSHSYYNHNMMLIELDTNLGCIFGLPLVVLAVIACPLPSRMSFPVHTSGEQALTNASGPLNGEDPTICSSNLEALSARRSWHESKTSMSRHLQHSWQIIGWGQQRVKL